VRRYSGNVTSPDQPPSVRPVDYKGEPLDSERGPGLGCFRFQVGVLVALIILTPLTVAWGWPVEISIALLFATLLLLLFAGQTVIFLLRLVAADRRDGRRVPLADATPTVGELEDAAPASAVSPAKDPWRAVGQVPAPAPAADEAPALAEAPVPADEPAPAPAPAAGVGDGPDLAPGAEPAQAADPGVRE
jgi:hypothetical protein